MNKVLRNILSRQECQLVRINIAGNSMGDSGIQVLRSGLAVSICYILVVVIYSLLIPYIFCPFVCLSVCLIVSLPICLSTCLFVCLFICVYLSIYLSVCLFVSVYLFTCLLVCVCLPAYLPTCPFVDFSNVCPSIHHLISHLISQPAS